VRPQREHQNGQAHSGHDPSGVTTSFDGLAKGLATGAVSRRKALRWMSGALLGAALASVPGVGWAAKGGNSACAHFCNEVFPPRPQRGQCKSQGAKVVGVGEWRPTSTRPSWNAEPRLPQGQEDS
jgi:hypothetical protein